jgi:dephospho-CoA kinase
MTPSQRSHQPCTTVRWKHGTIPVIGLTGGVAGGKSEVAAILAEGGSAIIDADSIGHELLNDPGVRDRIVARFGGGVLAGTGLEPGAAPAIDRRALGAIVFAVPEERRALEAIVHPLMRARFLAAIHREMQAECNQARSVVLDAAILLEAGWDDLCDLVVFVDAPRVDRMRRAIQQRGWTAQTFEARERAQWPCAEKRRRASLVIANQAGVDSLRQELERLDILLAQASFPPVEPCCEGAGPGAAEPALPNPARMVFDTPPRRPEGDLAATS